MKANTPYLLKARDEFPFHFVENTEIKSTISPEDYVVNVGDATVRNLRSQRQ